jgi:hypothetical protein
MPWGSVVSEAIRETDFTVSDVEFANFGTTKNCKRNFVFQSNAGASDASANTFLSKISLVNVDYEAKINFAAATSQWLGYQHCGTFVCTGLNNMIVRDEDGSFLGYKGTVMP